MSTAAIRPRSVLLTVWGFVIWAIAFAALYSVISIGCRFGWEAVAVMPGVTLQRAVLILLFALSLLANLIFAIGARRLALTMQNNSPTTKRFLHSVAFWSAIAALAATTLTFLPVFALSACV